MAGGCISIEIAERLGDTLHETVKRRFEWREYMRCMENQLRCVMFNREESFDRTSVRC